MSPAQSTPGVLGGACIASASWKRWHTPKRIMIMSGFLRTTLAGARMIFANCWKRIAMTCQTSSPLVTSETSEAGCGGEQ